MNRIYLPGFVQRAAGDEDPSKPLRFVVATEGRKADGLNLIMKGASLERFKANPVVMPNHDYSRLPIGRAEDVSIEGGKLLATTIFDTGSAEGAEYDRLYRGGFLNTVSIGFDVRDMDPKTGDVTDWEMIEFSAVSIPMDPSAVVESGRALTVARAFAVAREGSELTDEDTSAVEQAIEALSALLAASQNDEGEESGGDPDGDEGDAERGLSRHAVRLGLDHMERMSSV